MGPDGTTQFPEAEIEDRNLIGQNKKAWMSKSPTRIVPFPEFQGSGLENKSVQVELLFHRFNFIYVWVQSRE